MDNVQDSEGKRLTFALGIVASWLAYISVRDKFINFLTASLENILLIGITTSAVLSFLFLISSAAQLKYNNVSYTGDLWVGEKAKHTLYDLSIDVIGLIPSYIISSFIIKLIYKYSDTKLEITIWLIIYLFLGILITKAIWRIVLFTAGLAYEDNRKALPIWFKRTFIGLVAIFSGCYTVYTSVLIHGFWHTPLYIIGIIFAGIGLTFIKPVEVINGLIIRCLSSLSKAMLKFIKKLIEFIVK